MPITSELENRRKLKAVGFTDAQSEVLVEVIERSVQQGFDRFVEVFERGIGELRHEMARMEARLETRLVALDGKLDARIESVRAELHSSLRDQMLKFVTILISVIGLAVAIIKLFPNWY